MGLSLNIISLSHFDGVCVVFSVCWFIYKAINWSLPLLSFHVLLFTLWVEIFRV